VVNGTVNVPPGTGSVTFTATGPNGVTNTFTMALTVLGPATLYGLQGVSIADGSTVQGATDSGGGGQVSFGNDTTVGSVFSLSPVLLHDRTHATSIDTNAGLTRGNSDVIGSVSTATPTLPVFPSPAFSFTGTQAITVNPGATQTLAPGQYGAVTVFSRAHLVLSAGTYEFTSLDLEPQAQLVTPSSAAETAKLFVRDAVIYRGSTNTSAGALAPLYLAYQATTTLTIESAFTGTIIAPSAQLTLSSLNGNGAYTGEFFAKKIVSLLPHTAVNANPFTCH
jgi:hypothetical protein